jgi:hypothetical protein
MRRLLLLPVSGLACSLALACADRQQLPTAPAADLSSPSLGVERGTAPLGFGFGDEKSIVFIGSPVEDLVSFFCTGTEINVDLLNSLLVIRPDGSLKQQLKGDDRVAVLLIDPTTFPGAFCEDPNAVPTLTGTAKIMLNDNDVLVSGKRADASQVHVVGMVTDENGQLYHLVAFADQVLAPGPDAVVQHTEVQIHLTPVGH